MDSYRNGPSHRHGASHASHRPLVEEQPGLEVYHPPTAVGDSAAHAPEVYYSEDVNPSQYTFYREGTPPPPDDGREKIYSGAWAGVPPSVQDSSAAYPHSDDPHAKSAKVCGIQRRLLWVVVPVIFFLILAIAIGIGVGVGVGSHVSDSHASSSTRSVINVQRLNHEIQCSLSIVPQSRRHRAPSHQPLPLLSLLLQPNRHLLQALRARHQQTVLPVITRCTAYQAPTRSFCERAGSTTAGQERQSISPTY